MNSKTQALHNFTHKKEEIKSRLSRFQEPETPRSKQVKENNTKYHNEGLKLVAKSRHERRHGTGKKTSKAEALEIFKTMSKER